LFLNENELLKVYPASDKECREFNVMGLQSNEFDQQKSTESILVQVVLRNVKIDNQRFKFKSKLLKYFLKKVEKLKVKLFKTFSLKPLRIIKLINLR
jgi:hypothetical protein